jgi:hypothetical protein
MERVFLFCFKSCLKGEGDNEYYDVLEVDSNASADEIKRQYKKMSLSLHPVGFFKVRWMPKLTYYLCFMSVSGQTCTKRYRSNTRTQAKVFKSQGGIRCALRSQKAKTLQ